MLCKDKIKDKLNLNFIKIQTWDCLDWRRKEPNCNPAEQGLDVFYNEPLDSAGRVPGGMIVLSQERTERSRTIPSFRKKRTLRKRSEKYWNC